MAENADFYTIGMNTSHMNQSGLIDQYYMETSFDKLQMSMDAYPDDQMLAQNYATPHFEYELKSGIVNDLEIEADGVQKLDTAGTLGVLTDSESDVDRMPFQSDREMQKSTFANLDKNKDDEEDESN